MIHIIVNPVAGMGKAHTAALELSGALTALHIPHKAYKTEYEMHGYRIASQIASRLSAEDSAASICCIGGDGTIQEVVGALANTGIPLGIIPLGSGNDFAASLKLPKNIDITKLARAFAKGNKKYIDLIVCKTGSACRYCANTASVGLDAMIVKNALAYRKRFGKLAYLAVTPSSILRYKSVNVTVSCDEATMQKDITLVTVCNGGVYGGGFKIAPPARMDDGKITACIINKMSRFALTALFPAVLLGVHNKLPPVSFIDCERLSISTDMVYDLNIDGNIYPCEGTVSFEVMPRALALLDIE